MRLDSWFMGKNGKKAHVVVEWDPRTGEVAIKRDGGKTWRLEVSNAEELAAMLQLLVIQVKNPYRGHELMGSSVSGVT